MAEADARGLRAAFEMAHEARRRAEVPVGCVFVRRDGSVLEAAHNETNIDQNGTRHAEIVAIDRIIAREAPGSVDFGDVTLYVTCEPCIMCASALAIIGVGRVVFACRNERFGGCGAVVDVPALAPRLGMTAFEWHAGLFEDEAVQLFRSFYELGNPRAPDPHRPLRPRSDSRASSSSSPPPPPGALLPPPS